MVVARLIEKVVRDGIVSIHTTEKRPERVRGGVAGFEMCLSLHTLADFEAVLAERHLREKAMRSTMCVPQAEYWEHRYATIQIEFVCEILKVHEHYKAYSQGQDHPPLSGRAVQRYQQLVAN